MSTYSPMHSVTPVINTSAYEAGDVVGSVLTVPGVFGQALTAILKNVLVKDNANQKAALTILFFGSLPSGTYTNNAAFSWGAGDFAKLVGKANILAADYETVGAKAVAEVEFSLNLENTESTDKLYAVVLTTGTPTYASASDLEIQFGVLPDQSN